MNVYQGQVKLKTREMHGTEENRGDKEDRRGGKGDWRDKAKQGNTR